jgi:hypothetical protein
MSPSTDQNMPVPPTAAVIQPAPVTRERMKISTRRAASTTVAQRPAFQRVLFPDG